MPPNVLPKHSHSVSVPSQLLARPWPCAQAWGALQVQWKNSTPDQNSWYTRDKLEEMGFSKLVNDVDAKEAARLGLVTRPLTEAVVQKHLEDLGLEAGFGTHSQMRGLSGVPAFSLWVACDAHPWSGWAACSQGCPWQVSQCSQHQDPEPLCHWQTVLLAEHFLLCLHPLEGQDLWQMCTGQSCLLGLAGC